MPSSGIKFDGHTGHAGHAGHAGHVGGAGHTLGAGHTGGASSKDFESTLCLGLGLGFLKIITITQTTATRIKHNPINNKYCFILFKTQ